MSNCPSMGLSDILPNGFKSFCWRPCTKVSQDYPCFTWCVFAPAITITSNHNLVKVRSDSSAGTMCIKQISSLATKELEFIVLCSIPTAIFPCPACCFRWHSSRRRKASGVLGSPYKIMSVQRASPINGSDQFRGLSWNQSLHLDFDLYTNGHF